MLSLPSGRELERERGKLERQEKKIITDIKKMAKTGQMVSTSIGYIIYGTSDQALCY